MPVTNSTVTGSAPESANMATRSHLTESEKSLKRQVAGRLKIAQERVRERIVRFGKSKRRFGDRDDLVGIADRQQIENDLLHKTEDGCIRADAEGERQHGGGGKSGGFREQSQGIHEIFADVFQETDTARIAALLGRDRNAAERAARRLHGVAFAHSGRSVFFRELLQVDREFLAGDHSLPASAGRWTGVSVVLPFRDAWLMPSG